MLETFDGLRIRALTCAVPEMVRETNSFVSAFGESNIARFKQAVGIERCPVVPEGMQTSDLAAAAAKSLFERTGLDRSTVDVLLFVTQTPDAVAPATSARLQARLELSEAVFALDINQGCTGFLSGLLTAAHFLQNPSVRSVLLLGGDTLTRHTDPTDAASAMLFGDAGFAAVIDRDAAADRWTSDCRMSASDAISMPFGKPFAMQGSDVFTFTVTRVPEQILDMMRVCGETPTSLDLLCLHQANAFIVRQVARMTGMPAAKVPCRIANRGNTSSASLPLLLCDLASEQPKGPRNVLFSAFGVGLAWQSLHLHFDFGACLPPITLA